MGLRFVRENDQGHIIAEERLYLTEDRRLVAEGDPDARWLYCTPGSRISEHNAEVFGLKAKTPHEDKAVKAPEADKGYDRAALEAEAEALGIKVHHNTKDETLARKIAEAQADEGEEE